LITLIDERDNKYGARFDATERATSTAMKSAETAVLKAETAAEKRFECVSIDTPILCADLVWRPAGDLQVGDELIACDEDAPTRHGRRFRRAVVTANASHEDALLHVTTTHGDVRCNAQHPWLVLPISAQRRGTGWRWVRASDLKHGDKVMRAADLWTPDHSWEAGWLAGMYDGEGCLSYAKQSNTSVRNREGSETSYLGVHLTLSQREGDTATRIHMALERLLVSLCIHRRPAGKYRHTQPFFHFIVTRRAEVLRILGTIRPPRLLLRSDGVWDGRPINGNHRETTVVSVESAGAGMIAALSTSTRTYIAGGFAMHNSVNEFRNTLSDQQRNLMPRAEVDVIVKGLQDKIAAIEKQQDNMIAERAGLKGGYGWAVGVIGLVLAMASIIALASRFGGQ
jgi:hypothetical protein